MLMVICSDLQGMKKPLCSPSQEITGSDFRHVQILAIKGKEHGHFWPCQLWSPTSSSSVTNGRKRAYLQVKKVSLLYFSIFHIELAWNLTFFHAIFPNSDANMQRSTVKEGEIRQQAKRDRELWAYEQSTWGNIRVERGCDDSTTIDIENIAPHD